MRGGGCCFSKKDCNELDFTDLIDQPDVDPSEVDDLILKAASEVLQARLIARTNSIKADIDKDSIQLAFERLLERNDALNSNKPSGSGGRKTRRGAKSKRKTRRGAKSKRK